MGSSAGDGRPEAAGDDGLMGGSGSAASSQSGGVSRGRKKRVGHGGKSKKPSGRGESGGSRKRSSFQRRDSLDSDAGVLDAPRDPEDGSNNNNNGGRDGGSESSGGNSRGSGGSVHSGGDARPSAGNAPQHSVARPAGPERGRSRGMLASVGRSLRSLSRSRRMSSSSSAGNGPEDPARRSSSRGGSDGDSLSSSGGGSSRHSASSASSLGCTAGGGELIVTVTSCRSDAYHEGRACGTSRLPRRAPSALKTFHELAVGVKDAYEAGGCTVSKPPPREGDKGDGKVGGDGIPSVIGGDGNNNDEINDDANNANTTPQLSQAEWDRRSVLFEFFGNLDFLLALVDEVAIDTATRGALKEDTTFRGLRDVIKKCNKVLDGMLVRRERKYTLMFRIVSAGDAKMLRRIGHWNARVERALGGVTRGDDDASSKASRYRNSGGGGDDVSESGSEVSGVSTSSARSSVSAVLRRGRELLPTAGRVRARRATPTPKLRRRRSSSASLVSGFGGGLGGGDTAGEDGYSSDTVPMTADNLARLQLSLDTGPGPAAAVGAGVPPAIADMHGRRGSGSSSSSADAAPAGAVRPMKPKDELLDVIRGLRSEQMRAREAAGTSGSGEPKANVLDEIRSNFTPKAEIPSAVPKLPTEYIHRHRLMKQVVNCLLDRAGGPSRDGGAGVGGGGGGDGGDVAPFANTITCITSRHSDKAGNGKTTLAVAAIQTVEVREFFSDGIAWIKLGRTPLGEREVRRLYEQLYDQLLGGGEDGDGGNDGNDGNDAEANRDGKDGRDDGSDSSGDSDGENDRNKTNAELRRALSEDSKDPPGRGNSAAGNADPKNGLATSRRSFQGGELEGMKEDLAKLLLSRRVLICLDDVCKMEDAKWFLFGTRSDGNNNFEDTPHRVLITTRVPGLVGPGITHEVFVRIFSEHEAVKLLLTAAGRRPNGLPKVNPVFAQARIIVKGCGNSPLALRVAGGMLRSRNRNWTLSSPAWRLLVEQCRTSLEEASRIRSFANSVVRLVDLSFATAADVAFRTCLRRCFVGFAAVFHDTDSLKAGKGVSRAVVVRLFALVITSTEDGPGSGRIVPPPPGRIRQDEMADHMDNAAVILDALETMNLVQTAGHALKSSAVSGLSGKDAGGEGASRHSNHRFYSMHESIKAIAEEMSNRKTAAFAPRYDEFTSFLSKSDHVPESPSASRRFPFDECMSAALDGDLADMAESVQSSLYERWNVEEYAAENTPLHLIRAGMGGRAAEVLVDRDFCTRRVVALGPVEATRRHVSDLIELRRAHSQQRDANGKQGGGVGGVSDLNIVDAIQEGATCIIDEVVRQSPGSARGVSMAICLSTMGEGLIKARQPKEASQRLEEAAGLYRELLGQGHIDVARAVTAVAKSLVKINETRAALIRFGEASSTYEDCDASHHFDSIANLQGMANLFVTTGDFQAASALYENVISRKQSVHGEFSVATAKTINDYAVILAKNGRMEDALRRYEKARSTYERALDGLPPSMSWLNHGESAAKCGFDTALINLNIASIKSKKGDIPGAISSYEAGVQGLRKYKEELDMAGDEAGRNRNSSHMRHLVSALGRIGSLRLKLGNRNGALEAYASLFKEVNAESPVASRLEKAKAHIKCATIYRQSGDREDNKHAIIHLREALNMYTDLYGTEHKDTVAVATSLQQWLDEQAHR